MTGISITVELNDLGARNALRDLLARIENPRGFYEGVGILLQEAAIARFSEERGPDGAPWTSLKPATIRARTRKGQLPLTILRSNSKGMSGSPLAGSINYVASNDDVRVGSPKVYAAIHQLGGTIEKQAGSRYMVGRRFAKRDQEGGKDVAIKAHTITIPARPYIGISAADQEAILEQAEDFLRG